GSTSGEISVITRGVGDLVGVCGSKPRHIDGVTFTSEAAREMKERVMALVGKGGAKGLTVSTFHNLGLNIIRHELLASGYKNGFSILRSEERRVGKECRGRRAPSH